MNSKLLGALLSPLFLASCTEPHLDHVAPEKALSSPHVIYGTDTREDITEESWTSQAGATAILVFDQKLKTKAGTLGESFPLCADEPFQDQPRLGFCSGVLVAANKVLTAGHCFNRETDCAQTSVLFGFTNERTFNNIQKSELYHCKKILAQENSSTADFTLLELDRDVKFTTPVFLASKAELENSSQFTSYSYPLGLPLKKDQAQLLDFKPLLNFFKVEVDTFAGSSGSPLFNQAGKLIGILSSGSEDYLEDDKYRIQTQGGCLNFNRCQESNTCTGERYFKTYLLEKSL